MNAAHQQRDRVDWMQCPLIVFAEGAGRILVGRADSGLCFPSVRVPAQMRLAGGLTQATEQLLGLRTVYCFSLPSSFGRAAHRVMECIADDRCLNAAFRWTPVADLADGDFAEAADFEAVLAAVSRDAATSSDPFSTLGWFAEVRRWVNEAVEAHGLRPTGDFRQWNAAPGFSLIRFATDRSAVWFKAAAKTLADELRITRRICELLPDYSVELLAFHRRWNSWLASEADGIPMDDVCCPAAWQYVAARLADLQIASIPHAGDLLAAGAADLATSSLARGIEEFVEHARALMQQQEKPIPAALTCAQIDELQEAIARSISEAAEIEAPAALGNIDFNPGNVIVDRARSCTFLDWAGAYVGYPFATFEYLIEHLRRTPSWTERLEESVRHAYWRRWKDFLNEAQILRLQKISPLLSVFLFATQLRSQLSAGAASAGYMRSLLRRMKREANLMTAGRAKAPRPA